MLKKPLLDPLDPYTALLQQSILAINKQASLAQPLKLTPMAGDASLRKYYLLELLEVPALTFNQLNQLVIMQTPPDQGMHNFIKIGTFLKKLNLNVPQIFAVITEQTHGYLLLSYLPDQLMFEHLTITNAHAMYAPALNTIINLQIIAKEISLPQMDRKYLQQNLAIFKEWYLQQHLNFAANHPALEPTLAKLLLELEELFVATFSSQPQGFVHVDYHSKNLTIAPNNLNSPNPVGILDFQDAMLGPITYDMVSLLQDAYLVWPAELVTTILMEHYQKLSKIYPNFSDPKEFLKNFYLTGLQRHLKNLGVFARLKDLYNKPNYMQYIPNLLHYIYKTCEAYPIPTLNKLKNLLQAINKCNA